MGDIDLPASVLGLVEFDAIEDLILDVLRTYLPDVPAFSLIPSNPPDVFLLVRKEHPLGNPGGDGRFILGGRISINSFTVDPDGDEKGWLLAEAVRVVMRKAWLEKHHAPGIGWVSRITESVQASRESDWATSAGPIQYADLPLGTHRYESQYSVRYRREFTNNLDPQGD